MSEAHLLLNNVKLKNDALLKLNMPINIELGEIRQLEVRKILKILLILDEDSLAQNRKQAYSDPDRGSQHHSITLIERKLEGL